MLGQVLTPLVMKLTLRQLQMELQVLINASLNLISSNSIKYEYPMH